MILLKDTILVRITNEKEWDNVQNILHGSGYFWKDSDSKHIKYEDIEPSIYDFVGIRVLDGCSRPIMMYHSVFQDDLQYIKFISYEQFIRKYKLLKLNK